VRYVAGRVRSGLPATVELADLVSDGVIGLLDAIDKFEPDRGLQFQTYAAARIRGAIIDGLRTTDWVPRSTREKIRDINVAVSALVSRNGRAPEDADVAAELGISVAELRDIYLRTSYTSTISLEASGLALDDMSGDHAGARQDGEDAVPAGFLQAVRQLPERDQIVIALYYWERLTLAEIGQVLDVTESRVSQLHSRATMRLHHTLTTAAS
jgi:RNA polymerase sigma factor for flagellar operon FliA